MRTIVTSSLFVLALGVCQAKAAETDTLPVLPPFERTNVGQDAGGKDQIKDKDKQPPDKKLTEPPKTDVFDQALLPSPPGRPRSCPR